MDQINKGMRNIEIEEARERGETYTAIAKRHGISPSRVRAIVARRRLVKKDIHRKIEAPLRHVTR